MGTIPDIDHSLPGGALGGVRVADFTQGAAGPWCTQILGDFGADVLKVEPPKGDWCRRLGPPFVDGDSPIFLALNRNKRSVVMDLKSPRGIADAKEIISKADVVVQSFRPGVMDRLGIGYQACRDLNDKLIYCSISGYGSNSSSRHRPAVDGVIQAVSGLMSITGQGDGEPAKAGLAADMTSGTLAAAAISMALVAQRASGVGQHVDISLYKSLLSFQTTSMTSYLNTGIAPVRTGSHAPYAAPNGAYPTGDGYIMIAANLEAKWQKLCEILDIEHFKDDPAFSTNEARVRNRKSLDDILVAKLTQKSTDEWITIFAQGDIICEAINTYEDVAASPTFRDSDTMISLYEDRSVLTIGPPVDLQGTPADLRYPPPNLGEHSATLRDILAQWAREGRTS